MRHKASKPTYWQQRKDIKKHNQTWDVLNDIFQDMRTCQENMTHKNWLQCSKLLAEIAAKALAQSFKLMK